MITNSPIWSKPSDWLKIYIYISEQGLKPYKEIQENCNVSRATVDHFMRWYKTQEATPKATIKAIKTRLTIHKNDGIEATTKAIAKATDNRDKTVDNIIDTIKKALNDDGLVYTAGKQERNRAKNISQNKELVRITDELKKDKLQFIYEVVTLSQKLQYSKKINNAVDFHYKWAEVYNYLKNLKEEKIDKKNNFTSDNVY